MTSLCKPCQRKTDGHTHSPWSTSTVTMNFPFLGVMGTRYCPTNLKRPDNALLTSTFDCKKTLKFTRSVWIENNLPSKQDALKKFQKMKLIQTSASATFHVMESSASESPTKLRIVFHCMLSIGPRCIIKPGVNKRAGFIIRLMQCCCCFGKRQQLWRRM